MNLKLISPHEYIAISNLNAVQYKLTKNALAKDKTLFVLIEDNLRALLKLILKMLQ